MLQTNSILYTKILTWLHVSIHRNLTRKKKFSINIHPEQVAKMEKMGYLFPPIIQRREMNFAEACESIQPFIKEKNKNKKAVSVIQTYNAQDQLIMTPIIR